MVSLGSQGALLATRTCEPSIFVDSDDRRLAVSAPATRWWPPHTNSLTVARRGRGGLAWISGRAIGHTDMRADGGHRPAHWSILAFTVHHGHRRQRPPSTGMLGGSMPLLHRRPDPVAGCCWMEPRRRTPPGTLVHTGVHGSPWSPAATTTVHRHARRFPSWPAKRIGRVEAVRLHLQTDASQRTIDEAAVPTLTTLPPGSGLSHSRTSVISSQLAGETDRPGRSSAPPSPDRRVPTDHRRGSRPARRRHRWVGGGWRSRWAAGRAGRGRREPADVASRTTVGSGGAGRQRRAAVRCRRLGAVTGGSGEAGGAGGLLAGPGGAGGSRRTWLPMPPAAGKPGRAAGPAVAAIAARCTRWGCSGGGVLPTDKRHRRYRRCRRPARCRPMPPAAGKPGRAAGPAVAAIAARCTRWGCSGGGACSRHQVLGRGDRDFLFRGCVGPAFARARAATH